MPKKPTPAEIAKRKAEKAAQRQAQQEAGDPVERALEQAAYARSIENQLERDYEISIQIRHAFPQLHHEFNASHPITENHGQWKLDADHQYQPYLEITLSASEKIQASLEQTNWLIHAGLISDSLKTQLSDYLNASRVANSGLKISSDPEETLALDPSTGQLVDVVAVRRILTESGYQFPQVEVAAASSSSTALIHSFGIQPEQLKEIKGPVAAIRECQKLIGDGKKEINLDEYTPNSRAFLVANYFSFYRNDVNKIKFTGEDSVKLVSQYQPPSQPISSSDSDQAQLQKTDKDDSNNLLPPRL